MKTLGLLVLGLIAGAWYAFVAWELYKWFAIPLGAPTVGWLHMWGLTILVTVLVLPIMRTDGLPEDTQSTVVIALTKVFVAAMMLATGWVIQAVA